MIDDLVLTNNGCIGGAQERYATLLSVSPNPAGDRTVLELTNASAVPLTLELYRADGALVRREPVSGLRHNMDLEGLPDGPYLVRIQGDGVRLVERMVIQR
jgi:hypothetical protein